MRHAAYLANAHGSRLTVVTAYEPNQERTTRAREEAPEEIKWRVTDSAEADDKATSAKAIATKEGVKDVHVRSQPGDPASALIDAAEDISADLIVVGSRGMSSTSRFLLGSVPNKISHHAPCDVLIVHTAD